MQNEPRFCIASLPNREKLVVEIFFDDTQWAEINQEQDALEVEFYPRPDAKPWRLNLQNVVKALDDAKRKLAGDPQP